MMTNDLFDDYQHTCWNCGGDMEYMPKNVIIGVEAPPEGVDSYRCVKCGNVQTYATIRVIKMLIPIQQKKLKGGE